MKLQLTKGGKTQIWYLPKKLLVQKSKKFRDLLSVAETISLNPSTAEETIETFASWVYTGNSAIPECDPYSTESDTDGETDDGNNGIDHQVLSNDSSSAVIVKREDSSQGIAVDGTETGKPWFAEVGNVDQQHYGRLLDLYLFATKYEVPNLKAEVLLDWQRHNTNFGIFPNMDILNRALLALPLSDGLIRFAVADFAWYMHKPGADGLDYDRLPAPFLAQLIKFVRRYANTNEAEQKKLHPDHDWCRFHDHSESERTKCRRRRLSDPDVKGTKDVD